MEPVTVEGMIQRVQWSPDTKIAGRPGFSGSLGVDRIEPAHFRITLGDFSGLHVDEAWRLNGIMSVPAAPDADRSAPPPYLVLQLNNDDPHALVPGMRIRVRGYIVSGDEGGTWTRYQALDVMSRPADVKPRTK